MIYFWCFYNQLGGSRDVYIAAHKAQFNKIDVVEELMCRAAGARMRWISLRDWLEVTREQMVAKVGEEATLLAEHRADEILGRTPP